MQTPSLESACIPSAITHGHQTAVPLAFQCWLTPAAFQGLPSLWPQTGAASFVPLFLRLPASLAGQLPGSLALQHSNSHC
jgi:hypothetical protein